MRKKTLFFITYNQKISNLFKYFSSRNISHLIQLLCWAHCWLDVESSDILPVLLQEGHKEVDTQGHIRSQLILRHADIANSNSQTEHLQHLNHNLLAFITVWSFITFFIWKRMVAFTSSTFCVRLSLWVTSVGNFPALLRPGPRRRGICLIRLSEAKNASYFLAIYTRK